MYIYLYVIYFYYAGKLYYLLISFVTRAKYSDCWVVGRAGRHTYTRVSPDHTDCRTKTLHDYENVRRATTAE